MAIGEFETSWLDPQARGLYAALHRPAWPGARAGVLLVPPLLHEQPRSRRLLAEVASSLAEQGLPCMRFDFFGTGDSCGNGDDMDFESMHRDLELAVSALRAQASVARVAVLAWRGAALPLRRWLETGGNADLVVLWEPITNGMAWLQELVECDAGERAQRASHRGPGACSSDPSDGQLMGFPVSNRLRVDLARASLESGMASDGPATWAVVRADTNTLQLALARMLALPDGVAEFRGGVDMDSTMFLTPPVRRIVDELGTALHQAAWA